MLTGKKFRIYPNREQAGILSQWIGHQRFIYNAKVLEDRYFRSFQRKSLALAGMLVTRDQQYSQFITEDTAFLREVPSQILRNGAYKWMSAYQRFFRKTTKGRPTLQKKSGRQSVLITKELFRFEAIDDRASLLHLGTKKHRLGSIKMLTHQMYATPDSISISVHGGQWHVSFTNEDVKPVATEADLLLPLQYLTAEQLQDVTIGLDRNVVIPVQASTGAGYDFTPEQKASLSKAQRGKRKWQRRFARRQKGSSNRRKAIRRIAGYDRKIANVRNDFAHQTSHSVASGPGSLLVFEELRIRNMTASAKGDTEKPGKNVKQKSGLNRSILNVGWGKIQTYTKYKGLKHNKLTITVPAHHSSQECSQCGYTHKDNRPSQAEFICQDCGFQCNADLNASLVIRKRGVHAVINNEVSIKVPKITSIRNAARRAGTVQMDAQASTPVERVSVVVTSPLPRSSRLKQETPTRTAEAV